MADGATGATPPGWKLACEMRPTCHKGTYKPLYGVSMKADWPEFWRRG
ncbi:MAG: photosynthetic reaction center cytochrome c subunit, partial [Betaproteobacteria bacterium]|nr:photosynthetic reaction center cytochrome c subunit [Betaproteobacteria bacterium]